MVQSIIHVFSIIIVQTHERLFARIPMMIRIIDDSYPRALQWCSTDPVPDNLVSLDISKCYPSILIDNDQPIPLYTIHDIIKPFNGVFGVGEYYIDEYVIDKRLGKGIKIEAGFYSKQLVQALIT